MGDPLKLSHSEQCRCCLETGNKTDTDREEPRHLCRSSVKRMTRGEDSIGDTGRKSRDDSKEVYRFHAGHECGSETGILFREKKVSAH